jgi:fucose permease
MRLPPRQKFILVFTFTLGIFATVVDVVRVYYLQRAITDAPVTASSDPSAIFGDSSEFAWNASLSLMWSAVEVEVGIICACIPTLKPLIVRILPAMLSKGQRKKTKKSSTQTTDLTPKSEASDAPGPLAALQEPLPVLDQGRRGSGDVSIREFLSNAPRADHIRTGERRRPGSVRGRARTSVFGGWNRNAGPNRAVYFGFVLMKKPQSMLRTSARESWKYCTAVTMLIGLCGFSYGLLNTLNNIVAAVGNMTEAEALGLTSMYWGGGYFLGPLLVGRWLVRHDEHHRLKRHDSKDSDSIGGFRTTLIVGLLIFGCGTLAFWPCAVLADFGGFMFCSFVVGFGLAVIETAANPFICLCGPMQYSEMRLLLAQGVQGVGSVLSGILAYHVYFPRAATNTVHSDNALSLLDVQWTYLGVTLVCVLFALFFYYMPLPEVTDNELQRLTDRLPVSPRKRSIGGWSLRNWTIALAVLAQWTTIACQETMSLFFGDLVTNLTRTQNPRLNDPLSSTGHPHGLKLSIPEYLLVAHTAFAVSRFLYAYMAYLSVQFPKSPFIPTPRTLLASSALLTMISALLVVVYKPRANPNLLLIPIVLFFFAEGPLWPLTFALGLRGQGKRTKSAGAWLTMGASGAAFWPFVIYAIVQKGGDLQTAFVVVVALIGGSLIFPLFLIFARDGRTLVDPGQGGSVNVEGEQAMTEKRQEGRKCALAMFGSKLGSKIRKGSNTSGAPPIVEAEEDRSRRRSDSSPRPPWEDQVLDTKMFE